MIIDGKLEMYVRIMESRDKRHISTSSGEIQFQSKDLLPYAGKTVKIIIFLE